MARAVNVMPPGESGHIDAAGFVEGQATGDFGPHFADQLSLYSSFRYKPMQFGRPAPRPLCPSPSCDSWMKRDPFGVPQIFALTRDALMEAFGYASAHDRLFQMDLFRRAGHGRLAEILGEAFVPMDLEVRTVSEGAGARARELEAFPRVKADLEAFASGVNRFIDEVQGDPSRIPVEFVLLNDLPIEPWTPDDTLAFGEFAGRFFGEFGHAELEMARELDLLTGQYGAEEGQKIFDDLYPLDIPDAPTTVPLVVGLFPRHVGPPARSGSSVVNRSPSMIAAAARVAAVRTRVERTVTALRRSIGLHGFGSNQYVVDGAHSASGHPLLVSEPQTGWAVPTFFWEVELHGGGFDQRGVTVPGLTFVPIGRNTDSGWAVTSGLDANADTFAEELGSARNTYRYNGEDREFETRLETIECNTPPTAALDLLLDQSTASICESPSRLFVLARTVHGPVIAQGDGVVYSRQSVVDGRVVESLDAWTRATEAHTARDFFHAMADEAFSFNFMYVDATGNAGYWHAGRYPIRPADVDPRLPIPGTGEFDWQGFEEYLDQPHAVNPPGGFLANWNNKPAAEWSSKGLLFATFPEGRPNISVWGPAHQVEPIQADLAARAPRVRFADMSAIERHVSAVDNRARVLLPYLLAAIGDDERFAGARSELNAWDRLRVDTDRDGLYDAPGLAVFDRWFEIVLRSTFADELEREIFDVASGVGRDGHFRSADNGDTPTFKYENALMGTFLRALRGETAIDYFGGKRDLVLRLALVQARTELAIEHGSGDVREPVEVAHFSPQGAGSVPDVAPLPNRGSYGQIVEAGAAPGR